MIRHITFPEKPTAQILEQLNAAGAGATLRLIPHGTESGDGVAFSIQVRPAAQSATADDDCDEPVNSSHVCPPQCP